MKSVNFVFGSKTVFGCFFGQVKNHSQIFVSPLYAQREIPPPGLNWTHEGAFMSILKA
jgi:hypothetical protein